MKTLIILVLVAVIGLAALGAGPDSFINNVGAGGMFLFSGVNANSAAVLINGIENTVIPITETIGGDFSLSEVTESTISSDTDDLTKEEQAELEVHRLINLEREKHGLDTLQYDVELASVAKLHSSDMANREYFSHETPEGLGPTDRAGLADYTCQYQIGNLIYSGIGENIHMVQATSIGLWSAESIAETAVSGWMDSPGHRKNILTSNFSSEGIGVSIDTFTIHVTQNFC